jgi:hypothetical protein
MGAPMGNKNASKLRGAYGKERLLVRFNKLAAQKKKLYSKIDISSPMSKHEKLLNRRTANISSNMQRIIANNRKMKMKFT